MSYKALLFCPDERTARTVTQVLSELEFQVEPCSEPFAAVKKLTTEHFDAVVVDCDNEQNGTLLFKSARNSNLNQSSLSVAVVEGQSGVAKAFRIGANLVLTKPINVEQSKGTLRVARGLLRKTGSAKTAPSTSAPPPVRPAASSVAVKPPLPPQVTAPFVTPKPAPVFPPPPQISSVPVTSASVFEVEEEPELKPEPAEAALLESMSDPSGSKHGQTVAPTAPSAAKQYPWQPVAKPMAGPMATALQHAAEAAGKTDSAPVSSVPAETLAFASAPAKPVFGKVTSGSESAAAAAPARSKTVEEEIDEPQIEPPAFSANIGSAAPEEGSKKLGLIAAVVLLAVATAGYVGWTRMHRAAAEKTVTPVQVPAATTNATSPLSTSQPTSVEASSSAPLKTPDKATISAELPSAVKKSPAVAVTVSPVPAHADNPLAAVSSAPPLMVKNEARKQIFNPAPPQEAADATAPDASSIASGSGDRAISGLVDVPVSVPQAAPQALKVSQGVSQGLLVKKMPPVYPSKALQMRIQGAVQLIASISKAGDITNVKVLSGDTMLARAAIDAVKQWKYKPYYLDSQPVEIQTQITVNFKLP